MNIELRHINQPHAVVSVQCSKTGILSLSPNLPCKRTTGWAIILAVGHVLIRSGVFVDCSYSASGASGACWTDGATICGDTEAVFSRGVNWYETVTQRTVLYQICQSFCVAYFAAVCLQQKVSSLDS